MELSHIRPRAVLTQTKTRTPSRSQLIASRVILLTLIAVLLSVGAIWLKGKAERSLFSKPVAPKNTADTPLAFRNIYIADGVTKDGFKFASYSYKASDCVGISYDVTFYDSATRAQEELQRKATNASAIVERGVAMDEKQTAVGERIVLSFLESDQAKAHAEIVLTRHSELISISSVSISHLLQFEKAKYRGGNGASFSGNDSLRNITFQSSGVTKDVTNDGVSFEREEFNSSDCEKLITQTWYFESPQSAQNAFELKLKKAVDISERGTKMNAAGKPVGTRAVAYFEAAPSSGYLETTQILWTDGSVLHSIEGAFVYALEFESRGDRASHGLAQR